MTIGFIPLPFGARDLKVYPLTGSLGETVGAGVDLPNVRTLSFSEVEQFQELRGDDALIAVHGIGPEVQFEIEGGGCSFEVIKTVLNGTIMETGTSPNGIKTFHKVRTDVRPYFRIEGQAISDSGGDMHIIIYRARITSDVNGKMTDSAFWVTNMKGRGLARASDLYLYDFVQNETATGIV
jgi:hypothetical protein